MTASHSEIPKPSGSRPLLGHSRLIDSDSPIRSFVALAEEMGPLFALDFPGGELVVASDQVIVSELCDEARFDKRVSGALYYIRDITRDALFTAHSHEPNWRRAHNILMPAFGMGAMANYFPMMLEVAEQLVGRWEQANPTDAIDVTDEMTRLTLETIGLCGFDYRFGSFKRDSVHPFVESMLVALREAMERAGRLPVATRLHVTRRRRYERHVEHLNEVVDQVIRERRQEHADDADAVAARKDLLSLMLTGADPESGERLSDENIRHQVITFLIAGHETTSGLLSFTLYLLLKHPAVLKRVYREVDEVLGADTAVPPTLSRTGRLSYLRQVLSESLRLYPTAPAFTLMARKDTTIAGRYPVRAWQPIMVLTAKLHRDPAVWGDNPELFDPDHFAPEREAARPPHSYKPFGNGQRACIGSQFALQEAVLALACLLQRFRLVDHERYELRVKETLTLKPDGFRVRLRRRTAADREEVARDIGVRPAAAPAASEAAAVAIDAGHGTPLHVLYGSNMGSAEQIAHRVAEEGEALGYAVTTGTLDEFAGRLPREGAVFITTASYNGTAPDNAKAFVDWLESGPGDLAGVRYSVLGVGNRDWSTTYQRIPRLVDAGLAASGAERLAEPGEADVRGDYFGAVDGYIEALWPQLGKRLGLAEQPAASQGDRYAVRLPDPGAASAADAHASPALVPMLVLESRELANPAHEHGSSKRHLAIRLPPGVTYKTGDHLLVRPRNSDAQVERVARRFDLDPGQRLVIERRHGSDEHLPLDRAVSLAELVRDHLELHEPVSARQIGVLAAHARCPPEAEALAALAADPARYREEVLERRCTLLDMLDAYPSCELPLHRLIEHLPPLHPRYYSISSSHRVLPQAAEITVSVVDEPAWSGRGRYLGACSSWLASCDAGSAVQARVRAVDSRFLPPDDPATPLVMVGPGTGVAPFRGFIQDRLVHQREGRSLGPAMLFFGCRHPAVDFLYRQELEAAAAAGAVQLCTAFSRDPTAQDKYVQDALTRHGDAVWSIIEGGGIVYVCGDAQGMVPGVRRALEALQRGRSGGSPEAAAAWLLSLEGDGRFLVDAWS